MARSSLKKAENKMTKNSSTTLHHYFKSPASGTQRVSSTTPKPKALIGNSKNLIIAAPQDIIVIDSESEVEIEVAAADAAISQRNGKRLRSPSCTGRENSKRVAVAIESSSPTEALFSFGKPTEILGGISPASSLGMSFGPPSVLLASTSSSTSTRTTVTSSRTSAAFQMADEADWGTGDDELALIHPDEDKEDQVDDVEEAVCPICERAFSDLPETDRDRHVNNCLDGSGSAPETPKSVPLKPLSTLPVPSMASSFTSHKSNAFSVLMNSCTENAVWNEASTAEASRATKNQRRKAPFYKVLQGMPIAVDAFRYGCIPEVTAYFLTHAHSDHYTNLSSSWKHGPIYCSEGTANLIIHMLSVDKKWVHPLPMDTPTLIPDTNGVRVTLIEANHCPGSSLFLFEGKQTVNAGDSTFKSPFVGSHKSFRYLHCGDFRASPQHTCHPAVKGKHIDHVYLDTTYLDPKYTFPPQPLVISACAELAKRLKKGQPLSNATGVIDNWTTPMSGKGKEKASPDRMLLVVGTYSVGKERIVKAVAQATNSKIYCDSRKAAILKCQPDPELHALLTSNPLDADVHILPLGMISFDKLQQYLDRFKGHFTKLVGFRPTGWTYSPPVGTTQSPTLASVISQTQAKSFSHENLRPARSARTPGGDALQLFPVPYSEHSSFFELTCFALSISWSRMIATVNVGSESSRGKMSRWIQKWEAERKKMKKGEMVPHRRSDYW